MTANPTLILAGWGGLVAFLVLMVGGLLMFSESLQNAWPASRALYAAIGMDAAPTARTVNELSEAERLAVLSIDEIPVSNRREDGMTVLTVRPVVRNASDLAVDLPPMMGILTDELGAEMHRWQFQPTPARLNPGEARRFTTETRVTSGQIKELKVEFVWPESGG